MKTVDRSDALAMLHKAEQCQHDEPCRVFAHAPTVSDFKSAHDNRYDFYREDCAKFITEIREWANALEKVLKEG